MTKKFTCPIGVMGMTDRLKATELIEFVQFLEKLNYESFWIPELFGREIMANTAYCIAHTDKIKIAPGIANIYVRDPTLQYKPVKPSPNSQTADSYLA